MNTFLSSAQNTTKASYQTFAREVVGPVAQDLEQQKLPLKEFLKSISKAGYFGITVPKEYGGQNNSFLDMVLFTEAISQYEPGLGMTLASHVAVIELLKRFGSDSQKSRFLPVLASGEMVATIAFAEEQAGTDWQAVETTIIKDGNCLVINGKKVWAINAELANLMVIVGKEGDALKLALINLNANALKGGAVTFSPNKPRLGLRSCFANDVEFQQLRVDSDCLIGEGEQALSMSLYLMDVAKVILAASCLGMTQGVLDQSVEHAKSREQFGQAIATFQAIQWKIADMSVESQAARLQTYRAAWAHDERPAEFRRFAAMSKIVASKTARIHTGEALQILGSFGFSANNAAERFYRDAKMTEICLGTTEAQKMILVDELGI